MFSKIFTYLATYLLEERDPTFYYRVLVMTNTIRIKLRAIWAVLPFMLCFAATAVADEHNPILIISSYNPDTKQTSDNIGDFINEYKQLGGKHNVLIENMNCRSFSEVHEWAGTMRTFLHKYQGNNTPALILLLGQEAWSSYISQKEDAINSSIPVLCGMVSRNAIMLPAPNVNLREWEPESVDVMDDLNRENILSGFLYEYDVNKNIRLIKRLYPRTANIAFISDNTYGGVSIQAHMRRQIKNFPDLNLILLDGRRYSLSTIIKQIENLPDNTAIVIGTWRVDKDDNFFVNNTIHDITEANPSVPCFSMTTLGVGYGAIGGYVPQYPKTLGKDLAKLAMEYADANNPAASGRRMQYVGNEYVFDFKKITALGISETDLPVPHRMENKEQSFVEKYLKELMMICSLFIILLLGYFVVFYYFFRVKKLKDALEQSEADNTIILNNLRADIRFITPDYRIKWFNNAHGRKMQRAGEDIQGTFCYETLYGLDKPCDYCPVKEALATGQSAESTIEMQNNVFINMLASPVYDQNHELMGVVVRSEDVSKDKAIERELRAAKEKAEESDRLKSAFLANMSHEIRTPLNAIVGFSSVLIAEGTSEEEKKSYAEIIQTNSDLLLRLINDILDISRLETGKQTFNFAPCEVVTLCSSVISTTQYACKCSAEFRLDAPFESFEMETDVQRLQQVLINLMSNAVKFTAHGSITLGLRIDKENDMAVFSVTDTGVGIPVEKQKLVFERFEKLDEYVQGTGLGLAICKITVNRLGGDIWVDENYTGGARFVFTHPIHRPSKENDKKA